MPLDRSRRRVLLAGGASLPVLLGGCSAVPGLAGEPKQVRIARLSVLNNDDRPRTFDVLIRDVDTDSVAFWKTYTARAMTDRDGDGNAETDGTIWESPVASPGRYALYARAGRESPASDPDRQSVRLPTTGECLSVQVEVGITGHLSIEHDTVESC